MYRAARPPSPPPFPPATRCRSSAPQKAAEFGGVYNAKCIQNPGLFTIPRYHPLARFPLHVCPSLPLPLPLPLSLFLFLSGDAVPSWRTGIQECVSWMGTRVSRNSRISGIPRGSLIARAPIARCITRMNLLTEVYASEDPRAPCALPGAVCSSFAQFRSRPSRRVSWSFFGKPLRDRRNAIDPPNPSNDE